MALWGEKLELHNLIGNRRKISRNAIIFSVAEIKLFCVIRLRMELHNSDMPVSGANLRYIDKLLLSPAVQLLAWEPVRNL